MKIREEDERSCSLKKQLASEREKIFEDNSIFKERVRRWHMNDEKKSQAEKLP